MLRRRLLLASIALLVAFVSMRPVAANALYDGGHELPLCRSQRQNKVEGRSYY
jgi:hypothetical protein